MAYDEYTPKEISSLMGLIDTYLRWDQYQTKDDRSYAHYHPSEWGKCLRSQQYKHYAHLGYIQKEFSNFDSKILRLFGKGHNMHNRWVSYFDKIGDILLGRWRCTNVMCSMFNEDGAKMDVTDDEIKGMYAERKTRIYGNKGAMLRPKSCVCGCPNFEYEEAPVVDEQYNFRGHADIILDCTNLDVDRFKDVPITFDKKFLPTDGQKVVCDFKTINSRAWTNQLKNNGPHKSYLIQLTIYTHILDCDYGILMYENKDNSEIRFYTVPRNEKWWDTIKYQAKTMAEMATGDVHRLPPPRPMKLDCYECINCDFRNMCRESNIWKKSNLNESRRNFYKDLL